MKKQVMALVVGALFSVPAFAICVGNCPQGGDTVNNITNEGGAGGSVNVGGINVGNGLQYKPTNTNVFAPYNSNKQDQQQYQRQLQLQGQKQDMNNRQVIAPKQSTEIEIITPRQAVPAAAVSAAGTTATCRIAGGASVGAVWGGFSFSGSVVDENCVALEIAKAAIWAGSNTGDADLVKLGTHIIAEQAKGLVGPAKKPAMTEGQSSTTPFAWGMDSSN